MQSIDYSYIFLATYTGTTFSALVF